MEKAVAIVPLKGRVQHYAWGGFQYIAGLLRQDNSRQEPFAELWMGTHPGGPSIVHLPEGALPLQELIDQAPETWLGARVSRRFERRLPFLFKVLDVRRMLSIQAHPNKRQAEIGFQLENEKGIPLDSPMRVFRDSNHKPEIMVAVTDFWLLQGVKPATAIREWLGGIPEWQPLREVIPGNDLAPLFRLVMSMPQAQINELLAPLAERVNAADKAGELTKDQPEYWAVQALQDYTTASGDLDRGIFFIFFLNLVHLQPGEGIYQEAGVPHAYLDGINIELMANSDNVFRGGLTNKHIDVQALMDHLNLEPAVPKVIHGQPISPTERLFPTPAPDFVLSRIRIVSGQTHHQKPVAAPQILIVLEGNVTTSQGLRFETGESFFVPAGVEFSLRSEPAAVLYKASVPVPAEPEVG